jgi:HlyD family secretion protein
VIDGRNQDREMDVAKKTNELPFWRSKIKLGLVLGVLGLAVLVVAMTRRTQITVNERELLIAKVQQGSLDITVDGYGQLVSARQQLITSPSQATVKEIVLKPGARVAVESVIARLENPDLEQQVENAKQELNLAEANLRQLMQNNQREKLTEQANLAELTAQLQTSTVRRIAEEKLVADGIVSKLTYEQSLNNEKQLKQRVALMNQSIEQLNLLHNESVIIQLERVKQQQGRLAIARSYVDRLTVKAGLDGVLQKLPVELGQSLNSGQEVALVGSATDLIALIRVPQGQAQSVNIGDVAIVDTRREKINGKVTRIDPVVNNNTVEIEVALSNTTGTSARPNLSVDCSIVDDRLSRARYVKRPVGVQANSTASVYVLVAGSKTARLKEIKFGRQAGQHIEVVAGVNAGEQLIVSDLSDLKLDGRDLNIGAP